MRVSHELSLFVCPSIRKRRARVAWLHGLRACRMVTFYFFCCSKFYVIRVVYECTVTYIKYILYNNAIYLIINNMHNNLNYSVHRGGKSG